MNRVPVVLFGNRACAESACDKLVREGISAEVNEHFGLEQFWFVSRKTAGFHIEVPAEQEERAEGLLKHWDDSLGTLCEAIRCPECGSLDVEFPQYARHSLLTNIAIGIAAELGLVEKDYYCENCHYTWPKEGSRPRRDRPHMAPYYFIEGIEQTTLVHRKQPEPDQGHREAA